QIVTVIALRRIARRRAEIMDVAGSSAIVILVISRSRSGAVFESSPGWAVAIGELLVTTIRIRQIANRKNCSGNFVDQLRGCFGETLCPADLRSTGRRSAALPR